MSCLRLGIATFGVSLLAGAPVLAQGLQGFQSPHAEIAAAETNISAGIGFLHTQYNENIKPGDSENGFAPGFAIGASVLLPSAFQGTDLYSSLSYEFNAGNLDYSGHYLLGGGALKATDRAVFNRIEGRVGLGLPIAGGAAEAIPFLAGGYQAWNRNIDIKGAIGTDEFYNTGLAGGGLKLDVPLTSTVVVSSTAEMLLQFGGNIVFDSFNVSHGLGDSAQERVSLGLDKVLNGPTHVFARADLTHFNYAGSKPSPSTYIPALNGELYEPTSTTTTVGVNLGLSYSF